MKTVKLDDFVRQIDARKAALGMSGTDVACLNSGERRTPEKRALLEAVRKAAKEEGREPVFKANF